MNSSRNTVKKGPIPCCQQNPELKIFDPLPCQVTRKSHMGEPSTTVIGKQAVPAVVTEAEAEAEAEEKTKHKLKSQKQDTNNSF
ncbi:hypothetical protein L1987_59723 [Smallanthus sonchifolius]|uniref:Uncharacterized protein n=1 Tax=Smallanthus sonchifolius TaxID=185202 RepID=A0ACB9D615_9ASTR|nr:hypothetical protein L1987_59723 [Smallanthus sonchifolius]